MSTPPRLFTPACLSRSASWQDLKDFFRPVVKPVFTEVTRDGDGIAEFETYDDMRQAIRK